MHNSWRRSVLRTRSVPTSLSDTCLPRRINDPASCRFFSYYARSMSIPACGRKRTVAWYTAIVVYVYFRSSVTVLNVAIQVGLILQRVSREPQQRALLVRAGSVTTSLMRHQPAPIYQWDCHCRYNPRHAQNVSIPSRYNSTMVERNGLFQQFLLYHGTVPFPCMSFPHLAQGVNGMGRLLYNLYLEWVDRRLQGRNKGSEGQSHVSLREQICGGTW
jgi:hypothetical protein